MKTSDTNGEDNDETNAEDDDETNCEDGDETNGEDGEETNAEDGDETEGDGDETENDDSDDQESQNGVVNSNLSLNSTTAPTASHDDKPRYYIRLFLFFAILFENKIFKICREAGDSSNGGTDEQTTNTTKTRSDSQFDEFMHKKLTSGLVSERIKSLLARNLATSDSSRMAEYSRNSPKRTDGSVHLSTVNAGNEMYENSDYINIICLEFKLSNKCIILLFELVELGISR